MKEDDKAEMSMHISAVITESQFHLGIWGDKVVYALQFFSLRDERTEEVVHQCPTCYWSIAALRGNN